MATHGRRLLAGRFSTARLEDLHAAAAAHTGLAGRTLITILEAIIAALVGVDVSCRQEQAADRARRDERALPQPTQKSPPRLANVGGERYAAWPIFSNMVDLLRIGNGRRLFGLVALRRVGSGF